MTAANQNFKIVISATDKATASIRRVNESMAKLMRPFQEVHRSVRALGEELGKNAAVRGLVGIERAAAGAARSVGKIAAPMAAIVGVGSIAGINAMVTSWGRLGFELANSSASIGVSSRSLQSWQGAARLAGISAEQMTASMGSFATTLQDAAFGRNTDAQDMLRLLGISLKKTADGAIDVDQALVDLSRVLSSPALAGRAQEQGLIARVLGVGGSLSLLRLGPEAIRRLREEAERLNPYLDPAKAKAFAEQTYRMELAFSGLRNTIADSLMPVMQPLIQQLTRWVQLNREPIGRNIGEWAKNVADWIGSFKREDWDKVTKDVEAVGNAVLNVAKAINAAADAWQRWKAKDEKPTAGVSKWGLFRLGKSGDLNDDDAKNGRLPLMPGQSSSGAIKGIPGPAGMRFNDSKLDRFANEVEQRYGLPPNILSAIKNFGERSDPNAVSAKGARGIMQFLPGTWAKYGSGDPSDPFASIEAGGRYMRDLLTQYHGNVDAAIAHYNGGGSQGAAVAAGGAPTYAETRDYLSRVRSGMAGVNGGTVQHDFTLRVEGLPPGASVTVQDNRTGRNVPARTALPMPSFGG